MDSSIVDPDHPPGQPPSARPVSGTSTSAARSFPSTTAILQFIAERKGICPVRSRLQAVISRCHHRVRMPDGAGFKQRYAVRGREGPRSLRCRQGRRGDKTDLGPPTRWIPWWFLSRLAAKRAGPRWPSVPAGRGAGRLVAVEGIARKQTSVKSRPGRHGNLFLVLLSAITKAP